MDIAIQQHRLYRQTGAFGQFAQIMQQAGTAMLAQANSLPQGVLSLLRG